jgi:hypothetical protein
MDLIEEAVHLLRRAPAGLLAGYYSGSLPFALGLLYFWVDMSRSPFAARHLSGASLGLAMLFLWMKFWQAWFAAGLRAWVAGSAPPRWSAWRCARMFIIQTALQPSAAVMLPAALVTAIPFGWAYAFYQNVTALGDGEIREVVPVFRRAWRQCLLWPAQNHLMLAILTGFAFCVFFNLVTVCYSLPQLLKMLLGIDSVYAQSPFSMFNSTFFAAMASLTYLCVDPIIKAVYVLRCFYGESLKSGEDLKAELKSFRPSAGMVVTMFMLLLGLVGTPALRAQDAPTPPASESAPAAGAKLSPAQLDQAIDGVIHQSKYAWRMPRERVADDDTTAQGPIGRFFERAMNMIKGWIKSVLEWLARWLDRWFRAHGGQHNGGGGGDWMGPLQALLYVLLVLVVCALVLFIMRAWQSSRRRPAPVASQAMVIAPDLADENVGADQLPEDGWVRLGRELLARGELRMALRAFYFASLAHLAARNLITIAKFKSNRDYERELQRRGHALPELVSSFGQNVAVFDRSWYGLREVGLEQINEFVANVERIKAV